MLAAHALRRRGHETFARATLAWTLAGAVGLAVLAVTAGRDARAPMAVLGAEGALLLALGFVTQRQRLVLAGALGLWAGVVSALDWFAPPFAERIAWMASCGLALLVVAAGLARAPAERFARRAGLALCDAAAIVAALVAAVALVPPPQRLAALRPESAPGYLALAALIAAVASTFRKRALEPLAWLCAGAAIVGLCAGKGSSLLELGTAEACLLAAALPLWRATLLTKALPPERPNALPDLPGPVATLLGVLALQVLAVPAIVTAIERGAASWASSRCLALAAAVQIAAAVATPFAAVTVPGALLAVGASFAGTKALGYELAGMPLGAALAAAALALAAIVASTRKNERLRAAVRPAAAVALAAAAAALVCVMPTRVALGFTTPARETALAFAIATGAALAASFATLRVEPLARPLAGGLAAVTVPLVAIAACDALAAKAPWYPLAVLAGAGTVRVAARRLGAIAAAWHAMFALVLASVFAATELAGDWLLTSVFALFALVGRTALGPLPAIRSWFVLVGAGGATWLGLRQGLSLDDDWWLPAVALAFAAAATFAPRVQALGIERNGTAWFVKPIAALGIALAALNAGVSLGGREIPLRDPHLRSIALDAAAVALSLFGMALGFHARGARRALFPAVCAGLAAFVTAPLSERLVAPGGGPWPDVELALIAAAVAMVADRGRCAIGYSLAGLALALTTLEPGDPTTPVTCGLCAVTPLALLWRERRAVHGEAFGWALWLAASSVVVFVVAEAAWPNVEVLLLLAAVAATLGIAFHAIAGLIRRRNDDPFARDLARASGRLCAATMAVGQALVVVDLIVAAGTPARSTLAVCGLAASAATIAVALRHAREALRERPVHAAVAAALVAYAFLVHRTTLLAGFDGHHLQVLTLAASGLALWSRRAPVPFARPLAWQGVLLPAPGIVASLTVPPVEAALALFLGAGAYGIAALALRSRVLPWVAVSLLNAALFALWRHYGIVDPSFYGVPAGLSLVFSAELVRQRTARAGLWLAGLVVLYGSIAVQVVRVEQPLHALALFVAGLATVAIGFARRRNDYLVVGTAAVIVDVVAWLARHGLERDFVGAALLVGSGLTVLAVAVVARRRRASRS